MPEEQEPSDVDIIDEDEDEAENMDVDDFDSALLPPRRINYQVLDKPVKDRVIGQTTYRVSNKQTPNLASKASKNSRNKKEILLHARGPKPGANRGQVKKSFF